MFSCNSEHIACDHTEVLGGGWASCLVHTGSSIFFLIQSYWGSTSAWVMTNQRGGNSGFEIEEIKLIWVHHIIDNEAIGTDFIHQVGKNVQVKTD